MIDIAVHVDEAGPRVVDGVRELAQDAIIPAFTHVRDALQARVGLRVALSQRHVPAGVSVTTWWGD